MFYQCLYNSCESISMSEGYGEGADVSVADPDAEAAKRARTKEGTLESKASDRPPTSAYTFADLEAEVEDLRKDPPPHVSRIGQLKVPLILCDDNGKISRPSPDDEGPWDLTLAVAGKEGDEAYYGPFMVRLRFDWDLWPKHIVVIRFQCILHHALTDDSGGMMMPFYKALPRNDKGVCTLRLSVKHVHDFLVDPIASWKIPADAKLSPKIEASLRIYREENQERLDIIRKYSKLVKHPQLFQSPPVWQEAWLHPAFRKAHQENTPESWRSIVEEHLPGEVFSFPIFTEEFCATFVEEIFNFYDSGLPARRPNSMNNYGIILNEIGMEPMIDKLQEMLQPLGDMLWPGPGNAWDGHHCFIVRYRAGEDLGLDMHTDDSDVTFNICLGVEFDGAGLQFCGMMGAPKHRKWSNTYKHVKGRCVCHLGRKRHGADDISAGERLNLILWNHSSTYRDSDEYKEVDYFPEEGPPDEVCVSYTHDRDYGNFKEYPTGKEKSKGRGWCPRRGFEYEGFKPDVEKEIKQGS